MFTSRSPTATPIVTTLTIDMSTHSSGMGASRILTSTLMRPSCTGIRITRMSITGTSTKAERGLARTLRGVEGRHHRRDAQNRREEREFKRNRGPETASRVEITAPQGRPEAPAVQCCQRHGQRKADHLDDE